MARFLWERGDEAIPSALAASRIYGSLSDLVAHYDSDLRDLYNKHKEWVYGSMKYTGKHDLINIPVNVSYVC